MVVSSQIMDKAEHNRLLEDALSKLPGRNQSYSGPRLMLLGSEIFDTGLVRLIESMGATIVFDRLCAGSSYIWNNMVPNGDRLLGLAYGYLDNLALYPEELRAFLDRGGVIAWGIVPNTEEIYEVTPEDLAQRLRQGLNLIQEKAQARGVKITAQELAARSLITPACGLGPTTVDVAERALDVLVEMGEILREKSL